MSATTAPGASANPASAFYTGVFARALGLTLRVSQSLAPRASTRVALRLFFTPLPFKRKRPIPAGWHIERWPFEQGEMAVYRRDESHRTERPRVLLVHGWAGHAGQMFALAEALAVSGLDPVLVDLPSHGRSSGWRATLPQFVRALWAASARLGPLHGVVAHSLGAVAASHAAANGLPVRRLALIAPSPPPALFLAWFADTLALGAGVSDRMQAAIERVEGVPLARFEPAWLGPRLALPTLVVHDDDDRVSPATVGQRLAAAVPGAQLLTTQGLGHRRILSATAVGAAVVAHLRPNESEM